MGWDVRTELVCFSHLGSRKIVFATFVSEVHTLFSFTAGDCRLFFFCFFFFLCFSG